MRRFSLVLCAFLLGCGQMDTSDIFSADESHLTGESAFNHLLTNPNRSPKVDIASRLAVMRWATETRDVTSHILPGESVVDFLRSTARARRDFDPSHFRLLPNRPIAAAPLSLSGVNTQNLRSELVIPRLDRLPIRDQGSRGTCAAFTGTGLLEFAVLQANPSLPTVDLSEQRFYYLSKPECHQDGCGLDEEGSWYYDGLSASLASSVLDIPTEQSCPYNPEAGSNDVQIPQSPSCEMGAVKVAQMRDVVQPDEIIATLEAGLPVPWASPLSDNWMYDQQGLITLADAGPFDGNTWGGHAYLIVGYRRLPHMPEEGGICFIIKNSWGTGWGVGGYSCMTLAWMQHWNYGEDYAQPIVTDVLLSEELRRASAEDEDIIADLDVEPVDAAEDAELPWRRADLFGPDEGFYAVEVAEVGATYYLRAFLESGQRTTKLQLALQDRALYLGGEWVGEVDGKEVILCSGAYDVLCSLRLNPEERRLYIEHLNPELRSYSAGEVPTGDWVSVIGPLPGGVAVEALRPASEEKAFSPSGLLGFGMDGFSIDGLFLRAVLQDGTITDAIKLPLLGLDIRYMGVTVGSLNPQRMGLCTGEYTGRCSLFISERGLSLLPSW